MSKSVRPTRECGQPCKGGGEGLVDGGGGGGGRGQLGVNGGIEDR